METIKFTLTQNHHLDIPVISLIIVSGINQPNNYVTGLN